MGQAAAKEGDLIKAMDTHIVMVPSPSGPMPTQQLLPFNGKINGDNVSGNVKIMGKSAATEGSTAENNPKHVPQGGTFQKPPSNRGEIKTGSATVRINDKPAARYGDKALTCNDPDDLLVGIVVTVGTVTVMIG